MGASADVATQIHHESVLPYGHMAYSSGISCKILCRNGPLAEQYSWCLTVFDETGACRLKSRQAQDSSKEGGRISASLKSGVGGLRKLIADIAHGAASHQVHPDGGEPDLRYACQTSVLAMLESASRSSVGGW